MRQALAAQSSRLSLQWAVEPVWTLGAIYGQVRCRFFFFNALSTYCNVYIVVDLDLEKICLCIYVCM